MFVKILRTVIIAVCGVLLFFFLTAMLWGIINHGNIVGSIYCLAVILICVFYSKLKKTRALRVISRIFAGVLGVIAVYSAVVSAFIISGAMNTPERAVEAGSFGAGEPLTVIILGCQTINGRPSVMLEARLQKGLEFLNENPSAVCIVTGGKGSDEQEPESVTMRRYLLSNGIDESRIYTEENSANTRENIENAKQIIEENGLPQRVVIVSEIYHVYRGAKAAKRLGLEASVYPAFSEATWTTLPSYWIREILAITVDQIRASV